jgi:drug/metabolite transporter (DMT)-like permease
VAPVELASTRVTPRGGYLGVAAAAASWGTWSFFLRRANAEQPIAPELSTFIVLATIGVVLCPLALRATLARGASRSRREWALIGAFGLSDALNCVLYFSALQVTSVAVAVLTHYAAPLIVAVCAPLVLREQRRRGTLLAVSIGLAGLTLLLAPWQLQQGESDQLVQGALLGLASALFYATSVLFNKRLSASFAPSELLVYHMPTALLLLAALVPSGAWNISLPALGWVVLGALGPGALAGVVFMRSLAVVPAGRAAVLTLVEPLAAITLAALAWGESLGVLGLLGAGAILFAGYRVVHEPRPRLLPEHAPAETGRAAIALSDETASP